MPCCCPNGEPAAPAITAPTTSSRPSWPRRLATLTHWALPITTLALIPKCPLCLAGYIALFTGLTLSLPAATATRWTLITFSIAALAYLLLRAVRRSVFH